MKYTKERFKELWEADENGSGITHEDVADCAESWGLFSNPKCYPLFDVLDAVLAAAGVEDSDNGCEFCGREGKDFGKSCDLTIVDDTLHIDYNAQLSRYSFSDEITINFCPMCGRKLRNTEK